MSTPMGHDPELDLAEVCLDAANHAEQSFEYWSQRADEAPTLRLRAIMANAAAEAMVFANKARAHADDLLYDYE
jgi:hypothetical protein